MNIQVIKGQLIVNQAQLGPIPKKVDELTSLLQQTAISQKHSLSTRELQKVVQFITTQRHADLTIKIKAKEKTKEKLPPPSLPADLKKTSKTMREDKSVMSEKAILKTYQQAFLERQKKLKEFDFKSKQTFEPLSEDSKIVIKKFHMYWACSKMDVAYADTMLSAARRYGFKLKLQLSLTEQEKLLKAYKDVGFSVEKFDLKNLIEAAPLLMQLYEPESSNAQKLTEEILTTLKAGKKAKHLEVTVVPSDAYAYVWFEDMGRIDLSGAMHTTPALALPVPETAQAVREKVKAARIKRFYTPEETEKLKDFPLIDFKCLGFSQENNGELSQAAMALAKAAPLKIDFTSIEHGNLQRGHLSNGHAFALVGRDTVEWSRILLEQELRTSLDDEKMRLLFSADLEIAPENIVFVEQPGDFHLDMHMLVLAPGVVVLNDPIKAAELQLQWVDTYVKDEKVFSKEHRENLMLQAKQQAVYMEKCKQDILKHQGLKVLEWPLVFGPPYGPMNFANGEMGTNKNGQRFFITNGGIPEAQEEVRKLFAKEKIEVMFADAQLSKMSVEQDSGALGCLNQKEEAILK